MIDFNKPVYEVCNENSEIKEIMKDIGFEQIVDPIQLSTVGRFMTINKGSKMKGIDIEEIKKAFTKRGYKIME